MMFSVSVDPRALSEIAQLHGMQILLTPEVQDAMKSGADDIVTAVRGAMHWQNPTGALEGSITPVQDSPFEIQIGSNLPYARRRNWGFDGPDSLGRVYHDLGAYYMENGAAAASQAVLSRIDVAIGQVFGGL